MRIPKGIPTALAAGFILMDASAQEYALTNRDLRATTVSAASGPATLVFTADPSVAGEDLFDVVSSDPGVVITLLVPSGVEIESNNASGQGFRYEIIQAGAFSNRMIPGSLAVPGAHTL